MQKYIVQLTPSQGDGSFILKTYFVISENQKKATNRAFREMYRKDQKFIPRLANGQIKFICSEVETYACHVCMMEGCLLDQKMPVKQIKCGKYLANQKWLS